MQTRVLLNAVAALYDDDRLVIQGLSVSAKGTERRCELSAQRFGGANVRPVFFVVLCSVLMPR
jgi:hypothetical protein